MPFVGALGLASAVVVAVTMLSALTLVPAMLAVLGDRARAPQRREHGHQTDPAELARQHEQSAFARWGRKVSDRPWPWALGSTLVLLVLAVPVLSLRLGQLDAGSDPTSQSDRRAYDLISDGFGAGTNGPLTVVLDLPDESQARTSRSSRRAKTLAGTDGVAPSPRPAVNSDSTVAVINVVPTTAPDDDSTSDLVDNLRDNVLPGLGDRSRTSSAPPPATSTSPRRSASG